MIMTDVRPIVVLERLASETGQRLFVVCHRANVDSEDCLQVELQHQGRMGRVDLWARPQVGGLVDFEVVDGERTQLYWKHLEGPTIASLEAAWREMLRALGAGE
jgi:hypothetical protein